MITILINLNEKLIVKKPPNHSRTVFKTAKQNQIIVYAFVSSNLFSQLNMLTELANNFACFFPYPSVQKQKKIKTSQSHTFSIAGFLYSLIFIQPGHLS